MLKESAALKSGFSTLLQFLGNSKMASAWPLWLSSNPVLTARGFSWSNQFENFLILRSNIKEKNTSDSLENFQTNW